MNNMQKWLIIGAVWVVAIGILLSGLRGRYHVELRSNYVNGVLESAGYIKQDTWTGRVYILSTYPVSFREDFLTWKQLGKSIKEKNK